ncbi:MAG: hypothetical protein RQ745_06120 [Longimicrobiales bacterium]|nr:hypothetical protein [Longimicrobiales bacterium]
MNLSEPTPSAPAAKPRIRARLALAILEVLQAQDAPTEFLEDENLSQTMPRRLGLSDVVERQVRVYRTAARRRERITDAQLNDLFQLVVRRPDAPEIFWHVGRRMAGGDGERLLSRILPSPVRYARARRGARSSLKELLGRRIGGFAPGPFALEGRQLLFVRLTPRGESCFFVSGLCQSIVDEHLGKVHHVIHDRCEGHGDPLCRWTITDDVRARDRARGAEWLPEPEAG